MTIYYATGIDGPGSGNNYASTVRCHFFKTEEEAKEWAEATNKRYGHKTDTGSFNGSKGWIFAWGTEHSDIRIKPMGESAARKICTDWSTVDRALDVSNAEDDESRLFYFKKFTPGCWLTTSVDSPSGEGFKWQYDAYSQKIEESVKTETKMKHVKLFEAFVASQKLNENDTLLDVFDEYGWSDEYDDKYSDILDALGVNGMDECVWITDGFPEFIVNDGKKVKEYEADGLEDLVNYDEEEIEDPHGNVSFTLYKYKGLKIGHWTDEMGYSAGLCSEDDVKKWEKIIKEMGEERYLY